MRRILLPLEQTERSLKALQYFRKHYSPSEAAVVLLMVDESLGYSATEEEEAAAIKSLRRKLSLIRDFLKEYEVFTKAEIGKAGPRIVKCAREYGVSFIAMTKSSKEDMLNQIGRTTEYVLINSPCNVCIVSETRDSGEYRGLVYTKAQSVVNLRGQLGNKQSECLLPSVAADCNYHIEVSVGKIRFYHTAYNPDTGNWDLPPAGEQAASVDIAAGEKTDIYVKLGRTDGKSDRIRIVNRGIKQEAVFNYIITPFEEDEQEMQYDGYFAEQNAEVPDATEQICVEMPSAKTEIPEEPEEQVIPDITTEEVEEVEVYDMQEPDSRVEVPEVTIEPEDMQRASTDSLIDDFIIQSMADELTPKLEQTGRFDWNNLEPAVDEPDTDEATTAEAETGESVAEEYPAEEPAAMETEFMFKWD